jgi:cytochrome c
MTKPFRLACSAMAGILLATASVAAPASTPPAPTPTPANGALTKAGLTNASPTSAALKGDPDHGKVLYQGCAACHSIEDNDLGPRHRGVVGRKAGTVPDYNYSPALKGSGLTWTETNLDHWLQNPSVLVPGTKMFFKMDDPQSRADIIAYLKELR